MKLATYISDLLYRYECVIIPNFGGFVTNEISAKVNAFTHTFNAPSKQLTFNSHLQNNDGLLANYIANVANVSYSNAVEIINAEVKNWKLQLKNEEIEFLNIEKLTKYIGGKLKFLIEREDKVYVFRLHRNKVFYFISNNLSRFCIPCVICSN